VRRSILVPSTLAALMSLVGCNPPNHCVEPEHEFSIAPMIPGTPSRSMIDGPRMVKSKSPRLVLTSSVAVGGSFSITHLPELEVGEFVHVRLALNTVGFGVESMLLVLAEPGAPQDIFAAYWSWVPNLEGRDLPPGVEVRYVPDPVCGSTGSDCGVSHSLEAEFVHEGQVTRVGRGKTGRAGTFMFGNGLSEDWERSGECTDTYDARRLSGFAIKTRR
jgi:hypothetical protein